LNQKLFKLWSFLFPIIDDMDVLSNVLVACVAIVPLLISDLDMDGVDRAELVSQGLDLFWPCRAE